MYGDGPYRPQIEAAIARTGTADRVHLNGRVPMDDLPALLAGADIGLVPSLPEPYLQYSLSTKLLEYAAMGLPIIASDLATFRAHFTPTRFATCLAAMPLRWPMRFGSLAADPAAAARWGRRLIARPPPTPGSAQAARYLRSWSGCWGLEPVRLICH